MAGMAGRVLAMVNPMSSERVGGIARYARERGWHLVLQGRMGCGAATWSGDGVIATVRRDRSSSAAVADFARRGIPVVDLTVERPEARLPRVTSDHEGIGRLAAEHFLERNYRNVVWFSLGWGHVHALRCAGLSGKIPTRKWVYCREVSPPRRGDWNVFSAWLRAKLDAIPKPAAALAYDETDAARLLYAALEAGIQVPDELAVLSIGNDPIVCENQPVPLSSIDQNLARG
ncbi:MAG: substrate-binding domain-containing protein, partial [Kiritimatiellae bacterium]|nr:substrate-binding domain-containing protein [Kiritimatiellia bacterium]